MEDNLLSTEQILLLENLTYLSDNGVLQSLETIEGNLKPGEELTVKSVLNEIEIDQLEDDKDYGSFMTGKDWKNILQAVENDETLCNMKIAEVHGDPGGSFVEEGEEKEGACSVLFVNEASGEAVVAFRGTVEYEWKDNVLGGAATDAADGVSTEYQEKALEWYQGLELEKGEYSAITVTGHSKGGNKAKYITIMDESVTRCLSFDGQGFSDEFLERYGKEIAKRQYRIENHNVEYDFVNLLLNDVGNTWFYQGFDYGIGGLAEAHCPNTFFTYDDNGNVVMMAVDEQSKAMKTVNHFLNSYLRSLSTEQKISTMELLGELVQEAFSSEEHRDYLKIITEKNGWGDLLRLLAYAATYLDSYPNMFEALSEIGIEFGLEMDSQACVELMREIKKLGIDAAAEAKIRELICNFLWGISGKDGQDRQVASIYVPLEKNRVFDTVKLTELGNKGKALMMTGSESCRIWDEEVANLKGFVEMLPTPAQSLVLKESLPKSETHYYDEIYETMGECIYNTTMKLVEDIPQLDTDAAEFLDGITGVLSSGITTIKGLEEELQV